MSLAKSNYLEDKILDHVLRNTTYTSPTNVFLALYTSNPNEDDSGAEVTGGSYARQDITFSASSAGVITSSLDLTFTDLPAATITYAGICDASTAGNLLYYGALDSQIVATAGSDVTFTAGDITVTET